MELRADSLSQIERYKILTGLVFPRPIALVSTRSENGVANCAPYSWFNAVCEDPPLVMISFGPRTDRQPKHSLVNILRTGEFVVNLVDEAIANGMHISSEEVPESESEFTKAGFTEAPGNLVSHPRIAEAPVSFECRLYKRFEISDVREIVFGEVIHIYARDGLLDPDTMRVAGDAYFPVGRLFGTRYCTSRERFVLPGDLPD